MIEASIQILSQEEEELRSDISTLQRLKVEREALSRTTHSQILVWRKAQKDMKKGKTVYAPVITPPKKHKATRNARDLEPRKKLKESSQSSDTITAEPQFQIIDESLPLTGAVIDT